MDTNRRREDSESAMEVHEDEHFEGEHYVTTDKTGPDQSPRISNEGRGTPNRGYDPPGASRERRTDKTEEERRMQDTIRGLLDELRHGMPRADPPNGEPAPWNPRQKEADRSLEDRVIRVLSGLGLARTGSGTREPPASNDPLPQRRPGLGDTQAVQPIKLPRFEGGRREFRFFLKQFERMVQGKDMTDAEKLSLIFNRCSSSIKAIIEPCLSMDDGTGYAVAIRTLKRKYGTTIQDLTKKMRELMGRTGTLRHNDKKRLEDLLHDLTTFIATAESFNALENYDTPLALDLFIARFDSILAENWRTIYPKWLADNGMDKESGRQRGLKCLCEFLEERVARAEDGSPPRRTNRSLTENRSRSRSRNRSRSPLYRNRASGRASDRLEPRQERWGASHGGRNVPWPNRRWAAERDYKEPVRITPRATPSSCPVCTADHSLPMCQIFRGMGVAMRRGNVQASGRCFVCLKPGHDSRNCTAAGCNVNDCGGRHSRWLHEVRPIGQGYNGGARGGGAPGKMEA